MSLFMLYFDDGPMDLLAGHRGHGMVFVYCPMRVSLRGSPLTLSGLAINFEASGNYFRHEFDAILHRELLRFITTRRNAGWTPHIFFHWERSANDDIDLAEIVDATVSDPGELFRYLHDLPNDVALRIAVTGQLEIPAAELVDQRLGEGDCPWFDGIVRGDGTIILMQHRPGTDPRDLPCVRPLVRSTLASLWDLNLNEWVTVALRKPFACANEGVLIVCGQGSFEHEDGGLVVVRNLHDGKLRWAAHFDDSGTFMSPAIADGDLTVVSLKTKLRWRFPLAQPERVRVER